MLNGGKKYSNEQITFNQQQHLDYRHMKRFLIKNYINQKCSQRTLQHKDTVNLLKVPFETN